MNYHDKAIACMCIEIHLIIKAYLYIKVGYIDRNFSTFVNPRPQSTLTSILIFLFFLFFNYKLSSEVIFFFFKKEEKRKKKKEEEEYRLDAYRIMIWLKLPNDS